MHRFFISEGARPDLVSVKTLTARGNQRFYPLPPPTGSPPYHLALEDILSSNEIDKIHDEKKVVFHCFGDSEIKSSPPTFSCKRVQAGVPNFFYNLGDVVYYNGESV